MKATFKPLGIAAAVAAASAAYVGQVNAQDAAMIDAGDLGDLAIIPYFTTQAGYVTGVHITNTSALTQVIKLRLRRGSDSMDALDFNLILSPYDVWTGTVLQRDNGEILFRTGDTSCTAPAPNDPDGFLMPGSGSDTLIDFRKGAEEGYIEVIGMAAADSTQPIYAASKHPGLGGSIDATPVPANCRAARSNFFRNATAAGNADLTKRGVVSSSVTHQEVFDAETGAVTGVTPNNYSDTGNVLSVSYFIRDAESGLEMGSKAVHISDFSAEPMMSNQEKFEIGEQNLYGYFYPDLDGGSPADTTRGLYDSNVRPALGVASVLNDWSVNAGLNVGTDWVVTLPGQYLMVHRDKYFVALQSQRDDDPEEVPCLAASDETNVACDFRDIPVVAAINVWDREEQETIVVDPEDELVVSPSVGETPETPAILLPYEVNVIKWFGPDTEGEDGVLGSQYAGFIDVGKLGLAGWANLSITADPSKTTNGQRICDQNIDLNATEATVLAGCTPVTTTDVPMVGFVSWKRSFPDRPDGNYGRLIDHSWTVASASGV
jgi:hypothetical protein